MDVREVKARLKSLGIRADKALGQHFLVDNDVAERSLGYGSVGKEDKVLEIGPGLGILTELLVKRAGRVVTVEMDPIFIGLVKATNLEYIEGDAVKIELPGFDKVVSNLPYSISSPITFKLLGPGHDFKTGVLMYQKEFAERLASGPGSKVYSRLSINAYVKARIELLDIVPSHAFFPEPKVDSCIVRLTPRRAPFSTSDWSVFDNVVKVAFGQRRKKLRNSLRHGARSLGVSNMKMIDFERLPFGEKRPEHLSPEQFGEITDYICSQGL